MLKRQTKKTDDIIGNLPADFGKDGIDELALRANAHEAAAHAVCRWLADAGTTDPKLLALLQKWADTAW